MEVENLSVCYDDFKAVNDVSFEVSEGEIFGFLGPNGAGKTTTIKVLTTLLPPTTGKVSVMGYDVASEGMEVRKRIGVVQQGLVYEVFLTVEKALNLYGLLWGVPKAQRAKKIDALLDAFGLTAKRKAPLTELSIGLQRRVQVAQEFLHDPQLLFLDEPTVGLDPLSRRDTLDLIKRKAEEGMTVFYTTHLLEEVEYLCDRAAVLDRGKIVALDTPRNLRQKYGGLKTVEITLQNAAENVVSAFLDDLTHYGEQRSGVMTVHHDKPFNAITLRTTEGPSDILTDIVSMASKRGVKINTLAMKEPSLEETFINIIQGREP